MSQQVRHTLYLHPICVQNSQNHDLLGLPCSNPTGPPYCTFMPIHCKLIAHCLQSALGAFSGALARAVSAAQVFPQTQKLGSELKKAAQAVHAQTDRDDVRTMANMYSNNLESEMKRTGRSAAALIL